METMIDDIRIYGDPVLRKVAEEITEFGEETQELSDRLIDSMFSNDKGIGLAAPQIGILKRMFVIDLSFGEEVDDILVMVNPEIVETEDEIAFEEGCLSVPEIYEMVTRPKWIKVKYQDVEGNELELENEDFLARVIQHELDHLDGILFIDHLGSLKRTLLTKKLRTLAKESRKA